MKKQSKLSSETDQAALLASAHAELRFASLQINALRNSLHEIETISTDALTIRVCTNALERHVLDRLIHARNLFQPKSDVHLHEVKFKHEP